MKDRLAELNAHVERTDKVMHEQESIMEDLSTESVRVVTFNRL
jgi:hypothetical protein